MESKIKSFDQWLEENEFTGTFDRYFDAETIKCMRFAYDNGIAETIKHFLKQVQQDGEE